MSSNTFAGVSTSYKVGKGPVKITKFTADYLEYYFSGGKNGIHAKEQDIRWKPGLVAIAIDGSDLSWIRHPLSVTQVDSGQYAAIAVSKCRERSGKECFLFANGYRIVWDNGSDKRKRKLKRKDIRAGNTLALLTELGFYDGSTSTARTTTPKITNKKTTKKKVNGKRPIAISWDGYEELLLGTVASEETDDGQTIVNIKLPNNHGTCEGSYFLQKSGKGTWQINCTNNLGAAGTLKHYKDGSVTGVGRDYNDKKVKFSVSKNS